VRCCLVLYRPELDELGFRQSLLEDPETMAYNHAYGGTISFPRERWEDWYARWVRGGTGERFYRYLYHAASGAFVGETAYHYDGELGEYVCDVVVAARSLSRTGLRPTGLTLLCSAARENGVKRLVDNIAVDNLSIKLFRQIGFQERLRNDNGKEIINGADGHLTVRSACSRHGLELHL